MGDGFGWVSEELLQLLKLDYFCGVYHSEPLGVQLGYFNSLNKLQFRPSKGRFNLQEACQ